MSGPDEGDDDDDPILPWLEWVDRARVQMKALLAEGDGLAAPNGVPPIEALVQTLYVLSGMSEHDWRRFIGARFGELPDHKMQELQREHLVHRYLVRKHKEKGLKMSVFVREIIEENRKRPREQQRGAFGVDAVALRTLINRERERLSSLLDPDPS